MKLSPKELELLKNRLLKKGGKLAKSPEYALFRVDFGNGSLIAYKTGTLVYSGKDKEKAKKLVEEELHKILNLEPRIGCDEAGKGEAFGPLVIACIYADENCIKKLISLQVRDSKKLKAEKIVQLAKEIKKNCRGKVKVLMPENYNRLYAGIGNLNLLMEKVYLEAIKDLVKKFQVKKVIVDKFSKGFEEKLRKELPFINFKVVERAENDPVVAAASIVAKAERLKRLKEMEREIGLKIHEGNRNLKALLESIPPEKRHKFFKEHFVINGDKK